MRWFMVPVSICAHVLLAALLVIVPLAAEDEWPRPAPLQSFMLATKVVPVPPQMIPRVAHRPPPSVAVTASSSLASEPDTPPEPTGPFTPGALPDVAGGPVGIGVPDGFGPPIAVPVPPPAPPVRAAGAAPRRRRRARAEEDLRRSPDLSRVRTGREGRGHRHPRGGDQRARRRRAPESVAVRASPGRGRHGSGPEVAVYSDTPEWHPRAGAHDDHGQVHASRLMMLLPVLAIIATLQGVSPQEGVDPAIRAAVERFYATQEAEDVAGLPGALEQDRSAAAAGAAEIHLRRRRRQVLRPGHHPRHRDRRSCRRARLRDAGSHQHRRPPARRLADRLPRGHGCEPHLRA